MNLTDIIRRIDEMKAELDLLRPINAEYERRLRQKFRLELTYHSNSIEGNSLTYGETEKLILFDLYAADKPGRDNREIESHNKLLIELDNIENLDGIFTEHTIRGFHKRILGDEPYYSPALTPENERTSRLITPGKYKDEPNNVITVTGEIFEFTSPANTPAEMTALVRWINEEIQNPSDHPLTIAASLHYKFIRIHPFDDGNGRMARILMNVFLRKFGYPPVIVKKSDKVGYLSALHDADVGQLGSFISYIGIQLLSSLELSIKGAKGENIQEQDDIDKELELLRQQLLRDRELEERAKLSSTASRMHVFERFFLPFVRLVDEKLNLIKTEFENSRTILNLTVEQDGMILHQVLDNTSTLASRSSEIQKATRGVKNLPSNALYVANFQGQSRLMRNGGNVEVRIALVFDDEEYNCYFVALSNSVPQLSLPYGTLPSSEMIDELFRKIFEWFMSELKAQAS